MRSSSAQRSAKIKRRCGSILLLRTQAPRCSSGGNRTPTAAPPSVFAFSIGPSICKEARHKAASSAYSIRYKSGPKALYQAPKDVTEKLGDNDVDPRNGSRAH